MIKRLKGLELPLKPGEKAIIYLESGEKAKTYPKAINEMIYDKGRFQITFTTTNSTYVGYVKVNEPSAEMYDGFIIKKGSTVFTLSGEEEIVEEILDVRKDGIKIKTGTGTFDGIVSLLEDRPG